jgi:hypothetical protein
VDRYERPGDEEATRLLDRLAVRFRYRRLRQAASSLPTDGNSATLSC